MNKCFISGVIESNVEFCFTLKKNPISIAKFNMKLHNDSKISVYALNDMADYCYKKMQKNKLVLIEGHINTETNCKVIAEHIYMLESPKVAKGAKGTVPLARKGKK